MPKLFAARLDKPERLSAELFPPRLLADNAVHARSVRPWHDWGIRNVGECDSMLFHTRADMPYRGLGSSALRDGIKIIRKLAADAVQRRKTSHCASSRETCATGRDL